MLKEFVEKIIEIGSPRTIKIGNFTYSTHHLMPVLPPEILSIALHTLTSILDYISSNFDKNDEMIINIENETKVIVFSPLIGQIPLRTFYVYSNFSETKPIQFGNYLDTETFIVMLQSRFTPAGDRDNILKIIGNISDSNVTKFSDDGVSQAVNVSAGISMKGIAEVPNPVTLAPFRTFPKVPQPASKFILRVRSTGGSPGIALFEADGGAWINEAILNIKTFFKEKLPNTKILA